MTGAGRTGRADLSCAVRSGTPIAPSTYYDTLHRQPSRQALRDEQLTRQIAWVHQEDYGVYGGRKVWLALNRKGIAVARCTVE
jgi:putative transposase